MKRLAIALVHIPAVWLIFEYFNLTCETLFPGRGDDLKQSTHANDAGGNLPALSDKGLPVFVIGVVCYIRKDFLNGAVDYN